MVGFSKPDTIYLLCSLVALSFSKLHFLEKQRLGGGAHICPLAFPQETGQVFLTIISGGQEVEVPWKSFFWNPLLVITSPVSSLGSEAAVREELCPFCLGSLETCLLPAFWVHSFLLHEKRWRNRSALSGLQFTQGLKTAGKVVLLPTYSLAREAECLRRYASWSLSLVIVISPSTPFSGFDFWFP